MIKIIWEWPANLAWNFSRDRPEEEKQIFSTIFHEFNYIYDKSFERKMFSFASIICNEGGYATLTDEEHSNQGLAVLHRKNQQIYK